MQKIKLKKETSLYVLSIRFQAEKQFQKSNQGFRNSVESKITEYEKLIGML